MHRGEGYFSDVDYCDIAKSIIKSTKHTSNSSSAESVMVEGCHGRRMSVLLARFSPENSLKLAKNSESSKFYLRHNTQLQRQF